MDKGTVYLPVDTLRRFMVDVFVGVGVPKDEADICADVLIASDLRGIESHGVGRLKMYYDRIKQGVQKATTNFEIVREGPTTAVVDGHHGMGMVIGVRAMQMAIDKAKAYGLGAVAVRHSSHYGIAGYYPLMAVKAGMIGFSVTNARPAIAPTFGVQPMLGTNPSPLALPPTMSVLSCSTPLPPSSSAARSRCWRARKSPRRRVGSLTSRVTLSPIRRKSWTTWSRALTPCCPWAVPVR